MEIIDNPGQYEGSARAPQDLIANGYTFSIGDAISEGFDLFKKKAGEFVAYTLLVLVVSTIVSAVVPFSGTVIGPVLFAGVYIMAHRIKRNEPTEFNTFFKGFDLIGPLVLYGLVGTLLVSLGLILLVLPGIYLAIAYAFSIQFIIFYRYPFWDGMEWSRKVISKEWFSFFGFIIVLGLINLAGILALGVGLLFTIPISICALYAAFDRITGVSGAVTPPTGSDDNFSSGYRK